MYNYVNKEICFSCHSTLQIETIYFSSKDIAVQAMLQVGENRIKKYYFEIKEDIE